MANNYTQATVSPELPAALFSDDELSALSSACGLSCERAGDNLYFFAEMYFCERGEDENGFGIDCLALFQEKLLRLDPAAYPYISINGAATCSKMRSDEFAGFAFLITRDAIRSMSTWEWLHEQTQGLANMPLAENRSIIIEVRGGVVQEVSNIPEGWDYEIFDHDNAEASAGAREA